MGAHRRGAERAVDADGPRSCVGDARPERLDRLARERAPRCVGDRDRDHDGQPRARSSATSAIAASAALALSVSKIVSTSSRSTPPSMRPADLLDVGVAYLVEAHRAEARVVDVGRHRERAVGRADRARRRSGGAPGYASLQASAAARASDAAARFSSPTTLLQPVVGLRDRGRAERVGLDDVRARLEELFVDRGDHVRARQRQQVVVALEQRSGGRRTACRGSRLPPSECRWIIVPMAPSRRITRSVSEPSRTARASGRCAIVS